MNKRTTSRSDSKRSIVSTSRRRFLQATGFGGLVGLATTTEGGGAAKTPTSPPDAPGAVANLSEYIETPGVFAENQEPPHVPTSVPFESVSAAHDADVPFTELESRLGNSPYFELLNGNWDFSWYEKPADVPDSYDDTDWESIVVPGCWQTQGYDTYVYLNTPLTWTGIDRATDTTPPKVPTDYNPVGVYRREFAIPDDWDDRKTFLNFEGVKQACFVWIDDQYVGYNQGSMTAAEFDITEYVSPGSDHSLTVQVYRFSDGEALETQDMFRFSGIFRSVYLYSTPSVHLRDFFVRTDLDEDYEDADLSVAAELANYTGDSQGEHVVRGHLFDANGAKVVTFATGGTVDESESTTVSVTTSVSDPDNWSAEDPALYTLVLEHLVDGSTTEAVFDSVGFREYFISGSQFHVNGQPVNVRGVNSHEHHPDYGRTVPIETVKQDMELMKQHNVNALRASHYPRDPSAYYLADEYGLYVNDEVNVETHWNVDLLGQTDEWDAQALERFRRMVQSNKNHSSIFMWSTGNEAGEHDVHAEMAEYVSGDDRNGDDETEGDGHDENGNDGNAGVDTTRLLYHQDNDGNFGGGFGGDAPWADLFGPRYPSPTKMAKAISADPDGKPIVMGEYAHSMGNSGGLFHDFWEVIQPAATLDEDGEIETDDQWRRFQGGFVWDWVDQAMYRPLPGNARNDNDMPIDGETYRFYDDNPFCLNGVVFEDRTIQPELIELKKSYEPVGVTDVDVANGEVLITNHHHFTNLSALDATWQLNADDRVIQSGSLELDVPPLEHSKVTIPLDRPTMEPGTEYRLLVRFSEQQATKWHEPGHQIAFEEIEVPFDVPDAPSIDTEDMPEVSITETKKRIVVTGDRFEYRFDTSNGGLSSASYGETSVLSNGPLFDLFRAPIQNEIQDWGAAESDEWFDLGLEDLAHTVEDVSMDQPDSTIATVEMETMIAGKEADLASVTYEYRVFGSGDIRLDVEFDPTQALRDGISYWLPRVGVAMDVPSDFDQVDWYGRGPHETYPDRKWGAETGRYSQSMSEQYVPYQPPSDNGNKSDVRWAAITNDDGYGLAVFGDETFDLNIDQYDNLTEAAHQYELEQRESPRIHVDHAVTGVGGTPQPPLTKYQVEPESMSFTIGLRPYSIDTVDLMELSQRRFP